MLTSTVIPDTMLGALFKPGNTNLVLDKKHPVRQPGKGEVLLKVAACGVCHSDVFWLSGAIGQLDPNTYIMGHEIAGFPVKLGEDVDPQTAQIGKLYSVLANSPCGTTGVLGQNGGFAEFVTIEAIQLVEVPDGVSEEVAAIASDAGVTAYNAVKTTAGLGQNGYGKKVLIFGVGGLGHLAVQYAKHFGATVYACDIKPDARKLALELGAVEAFDLATLDKKIKHEGFTVDITIDFAVTSQTFGFASSALTSKTGTIEPTRKPIAVIVGLSEENLTFSSLTGILLNLQIHTSLYGTRDDLVEVLDLFAKHVVKPRVSSVPLEKINEVLDDLRAYEVRGRRVVIPSNHHHH